MRSSRLLVVLFVGLFGLGAGGCRVYLVPAGQAGPTPENVEEEAPEDADEATTGEETDDNIEPAVREGVGDDDSVEAAAPVPRERPSADRDGDERKERANQAGEDDGEEAEASNGRTRDGAERETVDESGRVPPRPRERPTDTDGGSDAGENADETNTDADTDDADTGDQDDSAGEESDPDAGDRDDREREATDGDELDQREARREGRRLARRRAGGLRVPPGHYPPRGECRLWHAGRPPGQQPAPAPCEELADEELGSGVFVLYGGVAWDGSYDWKAVEVEHPGAVPRPVLMLVGSGG